VTVAMAIKVPEWRTRTCGALSSCLVAAFMPGADDTPARDIPPRWVTELDKIRFARFSYLEVIVMRGVNIAVRDSSSDAGVQSWSRRLSGQSHGGGG
jgi:hypothetical protein